MAGITVNNITDSLTPVGVSNLGTAIFDNVRFPAGSYVDLQGETVNYDEVVLDAVVMRVDLPKEIVRSKISGRNGAVKEYVSDGDFQIDINCTIGGRGLSAEQLALVAAGQVPGVTGAVAVSGFAPSLEDDETVQALANLVRVPDRVEVRSKALQNYFGINYVVISDSSFEKSAPDTWQIRLQCESDFEIDFGDFG